MNTLLHALRRALIAFAVAFLFVVTSSRPAAAAPDQVKVKRLTFPVRLSDGNTYSIVGYLYYEGTYTHRTLQVALHGGTYNHEYWDIPTIDGNNYSYARYMAQQNYAVLALDQLGAGESSNPDGDFLTLSEVASGVHQVLSSLRSRHNPAHHAFEKIVLVGHSLGAVMGTYVQAVYDDADALVSTGSLHAPYELPVSTETFLELLVAPYFEFPPALREFLFYHAPAVDPDVIVFDNTELSDVMARGFFTTTVLNLYDTTITKVDQVTGPVLVQLGEYDAIAPGSFAAEEATYWSSASDLSVEVLPGIGHDFNSHLDREDGWKQIDDWIGDRFGCR